MSADDASTKSDELQFDRVETETPRSAASETGPEVTCVVCQKSVGAEYYQVNGKPVCEVCRQGVTLAAATPRGTGPFLRAGVFGLAAAVAGAAIYYGVIALLNLEIGLVAILIGYMVGYAVRKGIGGRGGRRFQVLALVLTYWAVGLAYTPLAFKGIREGSRDAASGQQADSAQIATPAQRDSVTAPNGEPLQSADRPGIPIAFAMLFVFVFALPVMYVVGSFPGGLLSALIIGIGLRQAWTMTGAPKLEISGPYKVGAGVSPAAG
jgi:hypothetical protein